MAKKIKLKNVKLSDEELKPVTIGYLTQKKTSPIFLIIFFGIFFAFLYFIPEVNVYVQKLRGIQVDETDIGKKEKISYNQNDIGKEFQIAEDLQIVLKELTLSNFSLENETFSFNIKNAVVDYIDLGAKNYFIYLKDSSDEVVALIDLKDIVVMSNASLKQNYNIGVNEVAKIIVDVYNEDYISDFSLNENQMICDNEKETYVYSFDDGIKEVTYYYQDNSNDETEYYKYEKKKERFQTYDGVSITLEDIGGIYYEMKVDYEKTDITKLNDGNLFEKNTTPKMINFYMQNRGYSCK